MSAVEPIKRAVCTWAESLPKVLRVWLFGSRAKNMHREDSDVDIAVELDTSQLKGEDPFTYWMFEKKQMLTTLQPLIANPIDFQLYQIGGTPHVVSYVAESGVLLYEKPSSSN
ncbi:MAG: nucleotidyltransferase domain-containing protein [Burkholderiales bacterium]